MQALVVRVELTGRHGAVKASVSLKYQPIISIHMPRGHVQTTTGKACPEYDGRSIDQPIGNQQWLGRSTAGPFIAAWLFERTYMTPKSATATAELHQEPASHDIICSIVHPNRNAYLERKRCRLDARAHADALGQRCGQPAGVTQL